MIALARLFNTFHSPALTDLDPCILNTVVVLICNEIIVNVINTFCSNQMTSISVSIRHPLDDGIRCIKTVRNKINVCKYMFAPDLFRFPQRLKYLSQTRFPDMSCHPENNRLTLLSTSNTLSQSRRFNLRHN